MSDNLNDLSVLSQEGKIIGKLGNITIKVHPPSLSRFNIIANLLNEESSEILSLREELLASKSGEFSKEEMAKINEHAKTILTAQISKIAPLVVELTAQPNDKYEWVKILDQGEIENALSAQTCLDIIDAYLELSAVPEILKKMREIR